MTELWNSIFVGPLVNGLIFFYKATGNLGLSIIFFTAVVRTFLIPLTLPSLRAAQKMKEIAPHVKRLKERHKDDKAKFAQAQMDLYRQHNVNPAAGCLPTIVQFVILIALFGAFNTIFLSGQNGEAKEIIARLNTVLWQPLHFPEDSQLNTGFLYVDLTKPDVFHLANFPFPLPGFILIIAAVTQFLSSLMMTPYVEKQKKEAQKTSETADDFAASMQQSMLWIFPITTIIIGVAFPSGLVLYWAALSIFQLVQQYFVSGLGGLAPWLAKVNIVKNNG